MSQLEQAVIDAARELSKSYQASGSTLPPGERGVGGMQMTGWIRAEPFEDLLDATYQLERAEQEVEDDR